MNHIQVLDQNTINQIAAGEVIERPASVVKELVENAIDAKATSITVEIREGGISLIRITDNGFGIPKDDVRTAFLRHATSKIRSVEDLLSVSSLGFRGEALSSIAAVAQVELVTKTGDALAGTRYEIHGGKEIAMESVGCPDGTTFVVRNLFYNTPARRKFLKTPITEAGYIEAMIQRLALSNPDISIRYINNGSNKLFTAGNGNLKDMIYHIYGRETAAELLPIDIKTERIAISGYLGKPSIVRGNRSYENFFVNGRYIKSPIISKAVEDGYKNFLMIHKFPFVVLNLTMESRLLDINVHPSKMELRFKNADELYQLLSGSIRDALSHQELIPEMTEQPEKKLSQIPPMKTKRAPEPFETIRGSAYIRDFKNPRAGMDEQSVYRANDGKAEPARNKTGSAFSRKEDVLPVQETLFDRKLLSEDAKPNRRIIGQLFRTYWLLEYGDHFYILDQHAAHEKVLYEKLMREWKEKTIASQQIQPPMILTVNSREQQALEDYRDSFYQLGFQFEAYGGNEICIRGIPADLYGLREKEVFIELLDELTEANRPGAGDLLLSKLASMACKAAVKGNHRLNEQEAEALIDQLMQLENPYHCPHGRPTLISMSRTELERKFKRIQS